MEEFIRSSLVPILSIIAGVGGKTFLDFILKSRVQNLDEFKEIIKEFKEERDKQDLKAEKQDLKIENQGLRIDILLEESVKSKSRIESLLKENVNLKERIRGLEAKIQTLGRNVVENHKTDHNPGAG